MIGGCKRFVKLRCVSIGIVALIWASLGSTAAQADCYCYAFHGYQYAPLDCVILGACSDGPGDSRAASWETIPYGELPAGLPAAIVAAYDARQLLRRQIRT